LLELELEASWLEDGTVILAEEDEILILVAAMSRKIV